MIIKFTHHVVSLVNIKNKGTEMISETELSLLSTMVHAHWNLAHPDISTPIGITQPCATTGYTSGLHLEHRSVFFGLLGKQESRKGLKCRGHGGTEKTRHRVFM